MDKAYGETDNRKAFARAFISGAVEGACDAAIVAYPLLLITLSLAGKAAKDK